MFRIDRNHVNLATSRFVHVSEEEAAQGAEDVSAAPGVSASIAYIAEEMLKSAEEKAFDIVNDARHEAASLLFSAREHAEEERRLALQQGYAQGAEEGRLDSEVKYERMFQERSRVIVQEYEEMSRAVALEYEQKTQDIIEEYEDKALMGDMEVRRVIGELYAERERTYKGLENDTVRLALEIVRKIIAPAESELGTVFDSLIRNALRQISPEGKIIIRVSPVEYERFFSSGSAVFNLENGVTATAAVMRDTSLEEGDCIIDTESETVNAGVDTQLKYIGIAFDKADEQ